MAEIIPGTLHITAPDQEPRTVNLDKDILRIGRLPENDLVLDHEKVSRRHAVIYCDREPYRIQDLGSSNGTRVNGILLPAKQVIELKDGDEIVIDIFTLTYKAPPFGKLPLQERPDRALPPVEPPPPPPPIQGVWVGMPTGGAYHSRWLQYLPYIYSEDPFLGQYLLVFEDLFGPLDQAIDHFDLYLDPLTAPEHFLSVLADWLGLVLDDRWPAERRRAILHSVVEMYDFRGTKRGMIRLLEASTDCSVEIVENADGPHTFRVILTSTNGDQVDEMMVRYLIETNKPAHTVYQLEVK